MEQFSAFTDYNQWLNAMQTSDDKTFALIIPSMFTGIIIPEYCLYFDYIGIKPYDVNNSLLVVGYDDYMFDPGTTIVRTMPNFTETYNQIYFRLGIRQTITVKIADVPGQACYNVLSDQLVSAIRISDSSYAPGDLWNTQLWDDLNHF